MTREVYTWSQKHAKVVAVFAAIFLGLILALQSEVSLSIEAPGLRMHVEARLVVLGVAWVTSRPVLRDAPLH